MPASPPSPSPPPVRIDAANPLLTILDSGITLNHLRQSHAQLITSALALHPFPPSKLLHKLLSLLPLTPTLIISYAHLLLSHSPAPPIFSYNTLIKSHPAAALAVLKSLLPRCHVSPNQYTFAFLLSACRPEDTGISLREGEQARVQAIKRGFEASNVYVPNVLIKMYSSWGLNGDARKVFDDCQFKDVFSWNSMVGGYIASRDVESARKVFDEMSKRDVVSWSTIIAGYVQVGRFVEALELFREMQISGASPNQFTLTAVLAACANLVALDQGRWVHVYIRKANIRINDRLLAGLIDMYSKCGEIRSAADIFNCKDSPKHTIRPWNALLGGFAIHGLSDEAVVLFERMKAAGILPDVVTFVSLLNACSYGKLVEKGRVFFYSMKTVYGIEPEIEHYGCMVDLLGRAGLLNDTEELISSMPIAPDIAIWGSLLSACQIHGDTERAEKIGKVINELEPRHVGCNILLANIYSRSRRWTDAKEVRNNIEEEGRRSKTPGCSSIELNGTFHEFFVGDKSHPEVKRIYDFLDEMSDKLKTAGFVPEVREVLLDIDGEDRETALSRHSEKLAIAFGLISTPPGTPIRIVKNLRVCGDCHHATKFISKVYDREIVVRDRIRFHRFKDGVCSCKDYW